jgi:hypothetical protein
MKVIDISALRKERAKKQVSHLREFDDYYEYCFIEDYEMKYDDFKSDSIQLADIFVTLLECRGQIMMTSLQFPKTYDIGEIVIWLDSHTVSFNEGNRDSYYVANADEIVEGLTFKGLPIVLAKRGNRKLRYNTEDFQEVTEQYVNLPHIVNTELAKPVDLPVSDQGNVFLNGQLWNDIHKIEFDMEMDLIFVNGCFIVADYLDEYCGSIGFYKEDDSLVPIVFFVGKNNIYITLEEADDEQLCIVEQVPDIKDLIAGFKKRPVDILKHPDEIFE